MEWHDICFDDLELDDAEKTLSSAMSTFYSEGEVSVYSLYLSLGVDDPTKENLSWGWKSLKGATIFKLGTKWILKMPKIERIK